MNLKQTIKLAAKSIGARKGRTFLTMLGASSVWPPSSFW